MRRQTHDFLEQTGADELIVTAQIHDHQARRRSYQLLAQAVMREPALAA